ncbi:hypothetical protein K491DRAFT_686989 [Lophiostoma macrostomum CBS 122681]|uniref:Calcineurin-like phosphoesterase domain-containing protein n=1 Tax=Lophiostoma macrostomum CBS 122681 TaxID=1314788 RepID=A0A6A6TS78_9PLEO|nr:hypothetical protein K491DRAFT_686989 [Lophiostoma macrostomum CBS 122681]
MQFSRALFLVAAALSPLCLLATTWLYLYPLFHSCGFPLPTPTPDSPHNTTHPSLPAIAPFRLLALGDPQLEGDSSLPKPDARAFPSFEYLASDLRNSGSWRRGWYILKSALRDAAVKDLPKWLEGYRKRIDLWGNDWYLAHIVRQLRWWTQPSHVSVLGDLLGSQWVGDEEFERRAERYWGRVMKGMERVGEDVLGVVEQRVKTKEEEEREDKEVDGSEQGDQEETERIVEKKWGGTREILGADETWASRVINIAGNHDIGYAGDIDESRIERFERAFGKVNWDIIFTLPQSDRESTSEINEGDTEPPALRLVILNDMNLDTPALSSPLQTETYDFMNHVIATSRPVTDKTHATILLTHIPLHKESGVCVDDPYFAFFSSGHGVEEQNMLSDYSSKMVLESIFGLSGNSDAEGQGLGRRGIILNGHDHEGCDVLHYVSEKEHSCLRVELPSDISEEWLTEYYNNRTSEEPKWHAKRLYRGQESRSKNIEGPVCEAGTPNLREITLRSMMGDFSGYAGFLSAWFDQSLGEKGEWRFEFNTCGVGVQHWWWGVHIVDLILVVIVVVGLLAKMVEKRTVREKECGGPKKVAINAKSGIPAPQKKEGKTTAHASIRKGKT